MPWLRELADALARLRGQPTGPDPTICGSFPLQARVSAAVTPAPARDELEAPVPPTASRLHPSVIAVVRSGPAAALAGRPLRVSGLGPGWHSLTRAERKRRVIRTSRTVSLHHTTEIVVSPFSSPGLAIRGTRACGPRAPLRRGVNGFCTQPDTAADAKARNRRPEPSLCEPLTRPTTNSAPTTSPTATLNARPSASNPLHTTSRSPRGRGCLSALFMPGRSDCDVLVGPCPVKAGRSPTRRRRRRRRPGDCGRRRTCR